MKHWFNLNHLSEAGAGYIAHLGWAIYEAGFLIVMAIASLLHGLFPPLFNFKLLEIRARKIMDFYHVLPNHPIWEEMRNTLNERK